MSGGAKTYERRYSAQIRAKPDTQAALMATENKARVVA